MSDPRLCVVGLGRVGATVAAVLAARGAHVVGVDVDPARRALLEGSGEGEPEPGLREALALGRGRLQVTADHRAAVLASDATVVLVPTPSDQRGAYALDALHAALAQIGRALARTTGEHLVVVSSTVLPGATRFALQPTLEEAAGRRVGDHLGLCYSPAFVALGDVARSFVAPDFALIGEHDAASGNTLERLYGQLLEPGVPVRRMTIENAELVKLAVNTYLTTKIAFANMLADLCERLPGGDVDLVTDAIGLDRRIGSSLLTGGLGYGGPCLPRDNAALAFLARALGASDGLAARTDELNRRLPDRLLARLGIAIQPGDTVAVLGLGYKAGSGVTDDSQGVLVARALTAAGARVQAFDPHVAAAELARLARTGILLAPTLKACLAGARGVIVTTEDPAYRAVVEEAGPAWIVDVWRSLGDAPSGARLVAVGKGRDDAQSARQLAELWGET